MSAALHPAAALIGLPYRRGAHGPHDFDCWGLVRYYFETALGILMPVIAVGPADADTPDNRAAIRAASAASGWKPSGAREGREHDIVLMQSISGAHVGVLVEADGRLGLLHCVEGTGVCVQPVADLMRQGYHGLAYWRRS